MARAFAIVTSPHIEPPTPTSTTVKGDPETRFRDNSDATPRLHPCLTHMRNAGKKKPSTLFAPWNHGCIPASQTLRVAVAPAATMRPGCDLPGRFAAGPILEPIVSSPDAGEGFRSQWSG